MSDLTKGSSSSAPGHWRSRRGEAERGIPKYCRCGEEAVVKTSGTAKNPGRLFYCCPNGSEGDKFHLFSWADERVLEEIEDLKRLGCDLRGEMSLARSAIVGLERQIQDLKGDVVSPSRNSFSCSIL